MAEVLAGYQRERPLPAPWLLAAETSPDMDRALAGLAQDVAGSARQWSRRGTTADAASPWPAGSGYAAAIVRLPKVREELAMTLAAVGSVTVAGAPVWLVGHNDEGIRSAARPMAALLGEVETLCVRRHCRLLAARRPGELAPSSLDAWRTTFDIDLGNGPRPWVSFPGVFAHGRLDAGTRLLIQHLPRLEPGKRVLDLAAGGGPVAAAALAAEPSLRVVLVDHDSVALEAARHNVPGAEVVVGDVDGALGHGPFDVMLSNPPIHDGVAEDHAVLGRLIAAAPDMLRSGGVLQLVVQRRVDVEAPLRAAFGRIERVAEDAVFVVWRARRARGR